MASKLTPIEILEKLVAFPTVSRDTNLPLVDWVEDYLNSHDIECHRYYHESGEKAAIMAHVGPEIDGGIVFQVTPTLSRQKANPGPPIPIHWLKRTGCFMAGQL